MGLGKIQKMMNKEKLMQQAEAQPDFRDYQSVIFTELSKYVHHFVNFHLPFDMAHEIVLTYCQAYEIDKHRTHLVLSELKSNQRNTNSMFTDREYLISSL